MSAANCHLAGRMPHNAVWSAFSSAHSCSQEAIGKKLHYIAFTFERLVCEFAATLEEQRNIASPREHHSTGKRKPRASRLDNADLIATSEDPILSAVYETQPGAAARLRVPALSSNLTDAEKHAFRGDWISRAMSPADVEESIKVHLHTFPVPFCILHHVPTRPGCLTNCIERRMRSQPGSRE